MNQSHSAFYYYGIEHLKVNLYYFIKKSESEEQPIYISSQKKIYNSLTSKLIEAGISEDIIHYHSVNNLILDCRRDKNSLRKKILEKEKLHNGQKIKWIVKVDYLIKETSKKFFLEWEEKLAEVIKNTNSTMLCLYDFEDYMKEQKYIDDEIIEKSQDTHSHVLYQFSLEEK